MPNDDRTIHGYTTDRDEIVRYNRAGKWRIEATADSPRRSRGVTLAYAVEAAKAGTALLGRPGGGAFDRGVRRR